VGRRPGTVDVEELARRAVARSRKTRGRADVELARELQELEQEADFGPVAAGASTAYHLGDAVRTTGLRVVILDQGDPASDASGRNGGNFELVPENCIGLCKGLARERLRFLQRCYPDVPGAVLHAESERQEFGFNTPYLGRFIPGDGTIRSKYVCGLLQCALRAGVELYTRRQVLGLVSGEQHVDVVTEPGTIRAARVVVATNAFASRLLPELRAIRPFQGQVMLTEHVPDRARGRVVTSEYGPTFLAALNHGLIVALRGADRRLLRLARRDGLQFEASAASERETIPV
jgi:glycine/D-amino acid oxidase-like deaminating enzyme